MPAILGVAAVAAALTALLLLYGAKLFADLLSHLIPRFGVGPFHVDLGGLIRGAANAALHAVENLMDSSLHALVAFITYPVHVVDQLFGWLVNGITEAATTAEWIVDTYVPRYYHAALAYAYKLTVYAEHYAVTMANNVYRALVHNVAQLRAMIAAGDRAVTLWVISNIKMLERLINSTYNRTYSLLASNIKQIDTWLVNDVKALQSDIGRAVATGEAYTRAYATGVTSALTSEVAALDAKIVTATSTAISGAVGVITTDIGNIAATTWQDLDTAVTAATGVLATDFPDIGAWIKGLDITKALDIAGVTALSISTAGVIARYLEQCGIPNCRNLSAIGRALQDLFGAVEDGALLAFLIYLISDPEGAAAELQAVLGAIVDPLVSAGRDLLGVA